MATARDLLMEVDLPREVWSRSGRPYRGNLIRWLSVATLLLLGLAAPTLLAKLSLVAIGVAVFFAVPAFADQRLTAIETELARATKSDAAALLGGLEDRRWVALFAPHGWVMLQKGRLHLVAGDGRAAARALSECARVCNAPKEPTLLSGQARAYTLSGDRAQTKEVFAELVKADVLSARDRLDYGVLLLSESGRAAVARDSIERAAEELGEHPQACAALAIIRARQEELDEGQSLLQTAEEADGVDQDSIAQDLIKKARKALRPALKGATRKKTKAGAGSSEGGSATNKKSRKKRDKRKDRRERRKAGKARASGSQPVVPAAKPEPVAAREPVSETAATRAPFAEPVSETAATRTPFAEPVSETAVTTVPPSRDDDDDNDNDNKEEAVSEAAVTTAPPSRDNDNDNKEEAASETAVTTAPPSRDDDDDDKREAVSETAVTTAPPSRDDDDDDDKREAVSETAVTTAPPSRTPEVAKPVVPSKPEPAAVAPRPTPAPPPGKPGSLFNQIGSRVSIFKAPPLPTTKAPATSSAPKPAGFAKPAAPKLGAARPAAAKPAAPAVAAAPKVAAPPKISAPKVASSSAADDDWADMLEADDPPAPITKK